MTDQVLQLDRAGTVDWTVEGSFDSRHFVVDRYGYVYYVDSTSSPCQVVKYDSSGSYVGEVELSQDGISIDSAEEISYGYDYCVYICGSDGSKATMFKLSSDLSILATGQDISETNFLQIKADSEECVYTTSSSGKIRKHRDHYGSFQEVWELEYFSSTPDIIITENGNIYASGGGGGEWTSVYDPPLSYWREAWFFNYDSEEDIFVSGSGSGGAAEATLRPAWGATWHEGFRPTKIRCTWDEGNLCGFFELKCNHLTEAWPYTAVEETNISSGTEFDIDFGEDGGDIKYLICTSHWDFENEVLTYQMHLRDVEFYVGSPPEIVAITTDGETQGSIFRDNSADLLCLTDDGHLILKESDTVVVALNPATGDELWSYDTGLNVTEAITGVDGESTTNSMAGRIRFASDPVIDGDEAEIVSQPATSILFTQPTPGIEGFQTNIYPDPGQLQFQSNADASISTEITAGKISFISTPSVLVPVTASSGRISFVGPLDTGDIEGYQTVLKPSAKLSFKQHPATAPIMSPAPSWGGLVPHSAPTFQFSSNKVDINKQTIYATGTASFRSNPLVLGPDDRVGDASLQLPSLQLTLHQGESLSMDLPSFDLEINGYTSPVGVYSSVLPSLDMEAFAGGWFDIEMPSFIQTASASIDLLADMLGSLPGLRLAGTISRASEGDISADFPALNLQISGLPGAVSEIVASIHPLVMSGEMVPGQVVTMDESLPKLRATITSIRTGPAEIDGTLPSIRILAQSGEIGPNVLRYVKERSR